MGLLDFIYQRKFPGLLSNDGPFAQSDWQPNEHDLRFNPETNAMNGPPKGRGYFGTLARPDGHGVMGEYGFTTELNGKETEVPSMVPTLTPEEVLLILSSKEGERLPDSIYRKAEEFARQRVSRGLSPWAMPHEEGAYFNLLKRK